MEEKDFKQFFMPVIILVFVVLAFFTIKPIILPILLGLLFAYIFNQLYLKLEKKTKSPYLSASIIIAATLLIIIVPMIIFIPMTAKDIIDIYTRIIGFDFSPVLTKFFPSLMENSKISAEVYAAISQLKSSVSEFLLSFLKDTLLNLGSIIFGVLIFLFTFFFSLIESHKFKDYFNLLFPFPKQHQSKFLEKFSQVTDSVLHGELIVGIAQGLIAGVGYFMLGVPNALLLTILTAIVGVIPVIGPWLIWIPIDLLLFVNGDTTAGLTLLIYGLFVINWVDTLLRPQIVSSKAEMNSAIALIGTIGGLYAFGILGILIGPLILAYLILLIEIYKDKNAETSIVIREEQERKIP